MNSSIPPDPHEDTYQSLAAKIAAYRVAAKKQIQASDTGDVRATEEQKAIQKDAIKSKMAILEEVSFEQDIRLRKMFAYWILGVVIGWMTIVLALVAGASLTFMGLCVGMGLQEKVAITLLGTTSINVIGLLYVVARYLFPEPKKHDAPKG